MPFSNPRLGSYTNVQMKPTDTDERIVGTKNKARNAMFRFDCLANRRASNSDITVWTRTTVNINFRLLTRDFLNTMSFAVDT